MWPEFTQAPLFARIQYGYGCDSEVGQAGTPREGAATGAIPPPFQGGGQIGKYYKRL